MSRPLLATAIAACIAASPAALTTDAEAADAVVEKEEGEVKLPAGLDFEMAKLGQSKKVNLAEEFKDKAVLMVNVASRCGLTPQYKQLQVLHKKYADKGLAIVGVPCNQFGGQEPGSAKEISSFCQKNYGVEFAILSKSNVKSSKPGQCDLYKFLTSKKTNPKFAGDIKWNFTKFLYNKKGEVVARFEPRTKPDDKKVVMAIEEALGIKKG